ncbi:MAG: DUF5606 domain-containing protein [Bacteroidales bacterium]|nr:DUF5606 domain-containing protein [Bacteroidales bacterium]
MDLKEILFVAGKSGLYKIIARGNNRVVVESLETKQRMPLFATMRASSLSDICMFTQEEDIPLKDVFKKIYDKENGEKIGLDIKTAKEADLWAYLTEVLPEHDRDRIHLSDVKKLYSWYNLLQTNNLLSFEETDENKENENQQ